MSSCFFSSRLNTRISASSESRKYSRTAWPNEPVPPVMSRILSLNMGVCGWVVADCGQLPELVHEPDQLGPRRWHIVGELTEPLRIERAVDHELVIGHNFRVLAIGL